MRQHPDSIKCHNRDMRYENPLYLAEEAASLYQISGGRVALDVSRGAPRGG
nr:LLM class flavin-dependent oxidoreductase [Brevibacterium paucivorans]